MNKLLYRFALFKQISKADDDLILLPHLEVHPLTSTILGLCYDDNDDDLGIHPKL